MDSGIAVTISRAGSFRDARTPVRGNRIRRDEKIVASIIITILCTGQLNGHALTAKIFLRFLLSDPFLSPAILEFFAGTGTNHYGIIGE